MTGIEVTCPRCDGGGEIAHTGYSVNPFSGVPVPDPQCVETEPCPCCHGTGTIVRPNPRRTSACRPAPDSSSQAGTRSLPSDGRRAA